jgi:transcriptional regulator with XRE-family HTH domain
MLRGVSTGYHVFQGERVVEVRLLRALTQEQLATRLDCSVRSVQGWEAGFPPSARHLRRLSRLAGKPVSWFFEVAA